MIFKELILSYDMNNYLNQKAIKNIKLSISRIIDST